MTGLSAIVLAAGYSSRMGELKPLSDLHGRTLLAWAVDTFTAIGIEDIVVVTGHRGGEVAAAARELGARPIVNPRFDAGMYSSVQTGVAAISEGRRFFVLPVDCPLVRPETAGLLARTSTAAGAVVVLPVHDGVPGHPPLCAAELRGEVLEGEPEGGLRELISRREESVVRVETADPGVLHDADSPFDLERLRQAAVAEDLPSERRCMELLRETGAPPALVAHCRVVAAVALALATALNEAGQCLCIPLVVAGALLHDVARARPRHAEAGADLVRSLGYPRVAPLIAHHMSLRAIPLGVDETQVVYLADKLVVEDRIVGLEARFAARLSRLAGDEVGLQAALTRKVEAELLLDTVEQKLGLDLGGIRHTF